VADAAATKPQDGISLMPLLAHPDRGWDRDVLIEGPEGFTVEAYRALRSDRYLYVRYVTGERELYDLRRDPLELRSLHDDPAHERVEGMLARRLRALSDCVGRECRRRP
jgi:N-acetylglucosamine-6-sulfatase